MGLFGWLKALVQRDSIPPPGADMLGAATLVKEKPPSITQGGEHVSSPYKLPHDAVVIPPVPKLDDASDRFARCVAEVLKHEGGFVHHPRDPGGATNRGITLATLSDWRGRAVTVAEVQALSEREAREIYRARFWNAVQGDRLPAGIDLAVFDFAVNSGPGRAARVLQWQLGVPADGVIGPQTLAAVAKVDASRLASGLCRARLAWMRGLPTWDAFGKGWTARVVDVERVAIEMAR